MVFDRNVNCVSQLGLMIWTDTSNLSVGIPVVTGSKQRYGEMTISVSTAFLRECQGENHEQGEKEHRMH